MGAPFAWFAVLGFACGLGAYRCRKTAPCGASAFAERHATRHTGACGSTSSNNAPTAACTTRPQNNATPSAHGGANACDGLASGRRKHACFGCDYRAPLNPFSTACYRSFGGLSAGPGGGSTQPLTRPSAYSCGREHQPM